MEGSGRGLIKGSIPVSFCGTLLKHETLRTAVLLNWLAHSCLI